MTNTLLHKQGMAITITDLEKYYSNKPVLQRLNVVIPRGQFVAVVGRSGCGKSTLLRLLANLTSPTKGTIRVDNKQLSELRPDIRLMFQDDRLLPWRKIIDNVGLGLKKKWQPLAEKTLDSVGLLDRKNDWPTSLSGGQRQRIALARALIHKPQLLLLDEPLGALDALTRIEMQQLIERLWIEQGFTVLLVTHDVNEAVMMADRVILIEQGEIGLDIKVELPRPRDRNNPDLIKLESQVLERIFSPEKNQPTKYKTSFSKPEMA